MNTSTARIGRVPRAPVVELEGMGGPPAVAGVDFTQAPWPPLRLDRVFGEYAREHIVAGGGNRMRLRRFGYVARSA